MWCITLMDLRILKNSCIPGINPTWSWCTILLMYCWMWFSSILLRIFALMFISEISLQFSLFCVWYLCLVLVSGWWWPHRMTLVLYLHWYFLFVCVSVVDLQLTVILKFWYKNLYRYENILSCWSLNCKWISNVLHLYPPLLMISDLGGIIVHGWFLTFAVYILLWVSPVICSIFVSCCGLFFSA